MLRCLFVPLIFMLASCGGDSGSNNSSPSSRDPEVTSSDPENTSGDEQSVEDDSYAQVYRHTGRSQCEDGGTSSSESMRGLVDNGIDVIETICGYNTTEARCTACGCGTTEISIHKIDISKLGFAKDLDYRDLRELKNEYDDGYFIMDDTCWW